MGWMGSKDVDTLGIQQRRRACVRYDRDLFPPLRFYTQSPPKKTICTYGRSDSSQRYLSRHSIYRLSFNLFPYPIRLFQKKRTLNLIVRPYCNDIARTQSHLPTEAPFFFG